MIVNIFMATSLYYFTIIWKKEFNILTQMNDKNI